MSIPFEANNVDMAVGSRTAMNIRKIVIRAAVVIIGLPVMFVLMAVVGFYALWSSYAPNRTNGSIVSSGQERKYLHYVPRSYDRAKPTPLVISMHAAALWPATQMEVSQWNKLADEHGFIVVYPSGTDLSGGTNVLPFRVWGPRTTASTPRVRCGRSFVSIGL